MSSMQVKHHRGIVYFTLPDEYFSNAAGVTLADDTPPTDFYTYMWASDSLGVETNWDQMAPTFTQQHLKEGSPFLGKVGLGGAAVGILPTGVRRLHLDRIEDEALTLPT
ncbi:MAG: hypothetical protein JKY94_09905 [Rhodobacteraceae bacterium]|nr:hypothetical protein [Paracoccaceae bacterium]